MSGQVEAAENHEFEFPVNEDVLCYTQNKPYKAKVLDRRISSNSTNEYYLLHYHKWNSKWDEWIENIDHRIQAYTKENVNNSNQKTIKDTEKSETNLKNNTTINLVSNQKFSIFHKFKKKQ